MAVSGHLSLQYIHRAESTIENNLELQRLILAMDRSLQRAKHLHADFFLNYRQIGLQSAHERYAQPSILEASRAIGLSMELQKRLDHSQVANSLVARKIDLRLYLSTARRFAATSIISFELITKLAAPTRGEEALLDTSVNKLQDLLRRDPLLEQMVPTLRSTIQQFYINKKGFRMHAALNITTILDQARTSSRTLTKAQRQGTHNTIVLIQDTIKRIVVLNKEIKSTFHDFSLQEENLTSTASTLMSFATREVQLAKEQILSTRRHTLQLNILIAVFGFCSALGIAWLLRCSITKRILKLTHTAERLKHGDLSVSFDDKSRDELGTLARVFATMTSQRSLDIKDLHETNKALYAAQELLETMIAKRTNELHKLLEISKIFTQSPNTQELYQECVGLAKELLDFDCSTLMLLSPDKEALTIRGTVGLPQETIGTFSLVKGQGLSTYVVHHKQSMTVRNFGTEKRFSVPPAILQENLVSALCTPMMIGQEVMGVLIGHTRSPRAFSDAEISLYQSLANQAAVAIANTLHIHEIAESERKFRTFFDNANDAIMIFELEGTLLEANQIACANLGYSRQELLSSSIFDLISPEFATELPQHLAEMKQSGKQIFESAYLKRSGTLIPVELSCTLFECNNRSAILAVARDISERKRMEGELLKIERLESIGVLAGGIAHDFNNILASILGNINLARLDTELKNETQTLLEEAEKASLRARDLTQQLLTFAKGGNPVKELTSLPEVIRDCAHFILRGSNVSCHYEFDSELWYVAIDKSQISQVIQNLIINARQAMSHGGRITIHCHNVRAPQQVPQVSPDGRYLKIVIKDEGDGIPARIIDKIFDPYFTTKQQGSGLGLAVSHSIIVKHGGHIFASSTPDTGTSFTFYLPASSAPNQAIAPPLPGPLHPSRPSSARIMIMDDEPMVIQVTLAILKNLGYDGISALDGHEAIHLYREAQEANNDIDVVIMDLTIPGGMGGKEAAQKILALNPTAKIMVSSGYSNDPVMANFRYYGFQAAVSKPFQIGELSDAILQLIEPVNLPKPL